MRSFPVIAFSQTGRTMFSGPVPMVELRDFVTPPAVFDPSASEKKRGNRPLDKAHKKGIAEYLESQPRIVLNSIVAYCKPTDVVFVPDANSVPAGMTIKEALDQGLSIKGSLQMKPGSKLDVGDGQHREGAIGDVLAGHHDPDDPVYQRLLASSINLVIVEEPDMEAREQDYVDLQRNSKPVSVSSAAALDSRHEINRFTRELVLKATLFNDPKNGPGQRIEYLSSAIGKTKPKLYTLQGIRYGIGTALIGFGQRSTRGWEAAADAALDNQHKFDVALVTWTNRFDLAAGHVPGWKHIVHQGMGMPEARDKFVSCTGGGLTAFMGALHLVEKHGGNVEQAIKDAGSLEWEKDPSNGATSFFDGTLVVAGKVLGSRNAFESAANKLAQELLQRQGKQLPLTGPAAVAA